MAFPGELIPITLFITAGAVAIFTPITRAWARRMDREAMTTRTGVAPELQQRLDRMEHALDAIAIEVERISEGQRFTTRLLAERAGAGAPPGLAPPAAAAPSGASSGGTNDVR
jgi:hypothetical protein